jgi:NADPH2:quinone reductase
MNAAAMHTTHTSRALRVKEKAANLDALQLEAAAPVRAHATTRPRCRARSRRRGEPERRQGDAGHHAAGRVATHPGARLCGHRRERAHAEWVGREVYGSGGDIGITRDGSHARYLVLPEQALRAKPQGISMDEAGAVGVPFVTAYEGFRRSGMPQAGQTVLVLGANGKVGQAAVQLASQAGARVIAVQRHAKGRSRGLRAGRWT